jgi:DNA-binding SARP family transcriptional activator
MSLIPTLSIRVLGGLEISLDGRPVKLQLKGQALLAYLACHQPKPCSREMLADLLWPEQAPTQQRHSLRNCLLRLRRALGSDSIEGWFHCRLAGATSDIARFMALAETANPAILDLYRGRFLDEFSINSENFEHWVSSERRRIEELALHALSWLATRASASGAHEQAIRAARIAVGIDELNESSHQQMITVLLAAEGRVEAVRFFGWVRDILHRELGENPSEKTTQLLPDLRRSARSASVLREREIIALLEETLLVKTREEFVALRLRIRQALAERKPAEAA